MFFISKLKMYKKQATLIHYLELRISELEDLLKSKMCEEKKVEPIVEPIVEPKVEPKDDHEFKSFGCWTADCTNSIINKFFNFNLNKN